jgi:hypothetical protein
MEYRFTLEPYGGKSTRHTCPGCQKHHEYSRYIDTTTNEQLPPQYGKCNNIGKCGYWLDPYKDGYAKMIWEKETEEDEKSEESEGVRQQGLKAKKAPTPQQKPLVFIPLELLKQSRDRYGENHFVQYLIRTFTPEMASHLISRYHIGTSNSRYQGATVFWFIDAKGRIRAGQVKQFDESGHTAKYVSKEGKTESCTSWVHSILKHKLKQSGQSLPGWLEEYTDQRNYVSCLYGEHLLQTEPAKPVAIVEAPATAIVASGYFPQFLWLAVGSLSYLTAGRCQALQGRNVFLFPDLSQNGKAYELWSTRAKELAHLAAFTVSDLLERNATPKEREQGLDLRDYLTRFDYRQFRNQVQDPEPETPEAMEAPPVAPLDEGSRPATKAELYHLPTLTLWDVNGLEQFFAAATLPTHPVRLDQCTTISDVPTFVRSHLAFIKANNGSRGYDPYFGRLNQIKNILSSYS